MDEGAEALEMIGAGGGFAGFGDDDVRQVGGVVVGLVALDTLEEGVLALAVTAPAHRLEAGGGQGLAEHLAVPQKLVTPAVEGAVQAQSGVALLLGAGVEPVMSRPHPVEVGGREAEPAAGAQHAVGLEEK